jgi:hypothetical protein
MKTNYDFLMNLIKVIGIILLGYIILKALNIF